MTSTAVTEQKLRQGSIHKTTTTAMTTTNLDIGDAKIKKTERRERLWARLRAFVSQAAHTQRPVARPRLDLPLRVPSLVFVGSQTSKRLLFFFSVARVVAAMSACFVPQHFLLFSTHAERVVWWLRPFSVVVPSFLSFSLSPSAGYHNPATRVERTCVFVWTEKKMWGVVRLRVLSFPLLCLVALFSVVPALHTHTVLISPCFSSSRFTLKSLPLFFLLPRLAIVLFSLFLFLFIAWLAPPNPDVDRGDPFGVFRSMIENFLFIFKKT